MPTTRCLREIFHALGIPSALPAPPLCLTVGSLRQPLRDERVFSKIFDHRLPQLAVAVGLSRKAARNRSLRSR